MHKVAGVAVFAGGAVIQEVGAVLLGKTFRKHDTFLVVLRMGPLCLFGGESCFGSSSLCFFGGAVRRWGQYTENEAGGSTNRTWGEHVAEQSSNCSVSVLVMRVTSLIPLVSMEFLTLNFLPVCGFFANFTKTEIMLKR